MQKLALLVVAGLASTVTAAERVNSVTPTLGAAVTSQTTTAPVITPVPDQAYVVPTPAPTTGTPIVLYSNVKYKDQRNIAPCAVSKIATIPDPCNPCCCVAVEICVPPCACECVKVSKCGTKVTYDYGKYEVVVTSRHGRVVVNYND